MLGSGRRTRGAACFETSLTNSLRDWRKAAWQASQRHRWMLPDVPLHRRPTLLAFKYSPDQPRVPAGSPDGGQWTSEGGAVSVSAARKNQGHHYVPREVFAKRPLPAETRKVFEESTTGRLHDLNNNRYDGDHRRYNKFMNEYFDEFMERNNINATSMTPDHARAFLQEVMESRDPRIRGFNMRLWMREIMRRIRPRGQD